MEDTAPEGPADSKPWLDMIADAERVYSYYQEKCDNIDKHYADLRRLAGGTNDREFQIFWANIEVMRPIIYSNAPVPVATTRFKDRKPLPRKAADLIERALVSDFEIDDLHDTLTFARDDLTTSARGVVWVSLKERDGDVAAVAEHIDRKDFVHSPARKWPEVDWVCRRGWLTRQQWRDRFGDVPMEAKFEKRKLGTGEEDRDDAAGKEKAAVWEMWHKPTRKVIWVSPEVPEVLDEKDPMIDVKGFFPCPRPVYGTLQPRTLLPVPDFLFYKDQIEEINELTIRIGALSDALKVRGFYAGGVDDVARAVEKAFKSDSPNAELVPVTSHAALGGVPLKDAIVWLPVAEIATVIRELVALRRQIIEDVYEITGLSDLMRGNTDADETATAQNLKSQYGSMRVKKKQGEMQRLARDVTRLKAEIMAENFPPETLLALSQVDDLPSEQDVIAQARAQQQDPQQALANTVTIEAVMTLLREQRTRPFILEIETDSTIEPNEQAEKERGAEFLRAVGEFTNQALPVMQAAPETGGFLAETLRFMANKFRPGRSMDQAIDEMAELLQARQQQPDPQQQAAQAQQMQAQADAQAKQAEMQIKMQEMQAKVQESQNRMAADLEKTRAEVEKIRAETQKILMETRQAMMQPIQEPAQ